MRAVDWQCLLLASVESQLFAGYGVNQQGQFQPCAEAICTMCMACLHASLPLHGMLLATWTEALIPVALFISVAV